MLLDEIFMHAQCILILIIPFPHHLPPSLCCLFPTSSTSDFMSFKLGNLFGEPMSFVRVIYRNMGEMLSAGAWTPY